MTRDASRAPRWSSEKFNPPLCPVHCGVFVKHEYHFAVERPDFADASWSIAAESGTNPCRRYCECVCEIWFDLLRRAAAPVPASQGPSKFSLFLFCLLSRLIVFRMGRRLPPVTRRVFFAPRDERNQEIRCINDFRLVAARLPCIPFWSFNCCGCDREAASCENGWEAIRTARSSPPRCALACVPRRGSPSQWWPQSSTQFGSVLTRP